MAGKRTQLDEEEEKLSREEWEKLWAEEVDNRIREVREGSVQGIPAAEVFLPYPLPVTNVSPAGDT